MDYGSFVLVRSVSGRPPENEDLGYLAHDRCTWCLIGCNKCIMDYESFLLVRSIFHSPSYKFATKYYEILLNATSYYEMPTKVDFNQSEYKNFLVS